MDPTRGLTDTGEKQIPIMADFLLAMDANVGLILHSEFARGRDTAEGIAKLLDVDTAQDPAVGPNAGDDREVDDGAVAKAWKVIQRYAKQVADDEILLIISHGPLINALAAMLLESGEGDKFHFNHGTIAKFDTDEPDTPVGTGRGENIAYLHWMATTKLMKRTIKHDPELIESALRVADAALELGEIHLDEKGKSYYYDIENVKRWVLGGGGKSGNCDVCEDNADRGWIPDDDTFDSADGGDIDGPPAHPGCEDISGCALEYKEKRYRVYVESGERMPVFDDGSVRLREDGGWVTIRGHRVDLGSSEENLSDKAQRALKSMNKCGAEKQRIADKSEAKLSKALGVPRTKDNSAFDLRNDDVGIEIKTMVDGKNDKVTMSKAALGRKIAEKEAEGKDFKTFTVVADVRGGGAAKYYVSEKLGSIRLGSMTPINLSDLRAMVRNP